MIGIYKYENKINHKCYIGQSINIKQRQDNHRSAAYNTKANDYDSQFHQAVRKYNGFNNFTFEIIVELFPEEYSREYLNDLERYYVKYYNSFHNGYNATEGGDQKWNSCLKGELNGRALLTADEVEYIRECYNAHIPFKQVYKEFEDKISKRGFQNIWWFKTWKDIHPEYCTEENKYWHSHKAKANPKEVASNNKRCFSNEEVLQMRADYDSGLSPKEIQLKYAPDKAWSTIYNVVTRQTYKDIN